MPIPRLVRLLLLAFAVCSTPLLFAQEFPTVTSATETYRFSKDGRPIVLPVTIDGRKYQFLLDTGAAKTYFDISFSSRLGSEVEFRTLKTPAGMQRAKMFACPQGFVGSFPLDVVQTVGCTDIAHLRYVTGLQLDGILGANFCIGKRMMVNFDAGIITISTQTEEQLATWSDGLKIPVSIIAGVPQIVVELPDDSRTQFVVDTGADRTTLCSKIVTVHGS